MRAVTVHWNLPAAGAALIVLFAGCAGPSTSPQSGPSATVSPMETATGMPSEPSLGGFVVTSGEARVQLSGDLEASYVLPVSQGSEFGLFPDGVFLRYQDVSGNSFSLGGGVSMGKNETSVGFVVMGLRAEGIEFHSFRGECTVTITRADEGDAEGTFACNGLKGDGHRVRASGTFSASS
jgi:hypothetical protein